MPRTAWTDDRLDDLAARMDAGFDRVDRDIRDLRSEMHAGFAAVEARFDGRFDTMNARFDAMNARFDALQTVMVRLGGAMIICLLGAIVAFALGGS